MKPFLSLLIFFYGLSAYSQSVVRIINCNIIDPVSGKIAANQDILVEGDQVKRISSHRNRPGVPGETTIDGSGKWVIPGLTDAHIHFFQSGGLYARPDIIDLRNRVPLEKERKRVMEMAPDFLARYLSCGITTVCDMGGPLTNYDIRAKARTNDFAPDVYVTGPLISSYQPEEFGTQDPPIVKVWTPEEAREMVRSQIPLHPDYIKIWYIVRRGEKPEQFLPIVNAVVEESHKNGLPVAVHATQLETARLAVMAGANILVHSVDDQVVDQEFIDLLVEKKVSYIPTLTVSENYSQVLGQHMEFRQEDFTIANPYTLGSLTDLRGFPANEIPDYVQNLMEKPFSRSPKVNTMYENLRQLQAAGVNIVTGTDAGNIGTLHASSYYEEIAAMKAAGLSPLEILRSATFNAAKMLGKDKTQGTVAAGNQADLVLLSENPLENIQNLSKVHMVVAKGRAMHPDSLLPGSPELLAQQQLNAWNLKDIQAFANCFDEHVEVYKYPNDKQYTGRNELYELYSPFFKEVPQAYCEVVKRIHMGNVIIDEEKITGIGTAPPRRVVAIYEVAGNKIIRVTFIYP
ncbi:MAG: amidohydrolase family protein [Bacteroidia bacterium]